MIGDRWGVTMVEIAEEFPCDRLVGEPAIEVWRGVTIAASPEKVWSWLIQVRLAPYSYDWIDNLGRRSPRVALGLGDPEVGDRFTASGGRPLGRVLSVEPNRALTAELAGVLMSYVLRPSGDGGTRLLLKITARRWGGPFGALSRVAAPLLSVGDLVMARRQLLNFKRLAEHATRGSVVAPSGGLR
ncbi:SRPBCC family protein [Tsukamurella soli]|uniref:Polyketide cyclase / dehydrase and lipid transport n=1 Tax=Tsukamurella soli TaxID=644556 RepID=A0ABP8J710_9ACTN